MHPVVTSMTIQYIGIIWEFSLPQPLKERVLMTLDYLIMTIHIHNIRWYNDISGQINNVKNYILVCSDFELFNNILHIFTKICFTTISTNDRSRTERDNVAAR